MKNDDVMYSVFLQKCENLSKAMKYLRLIMSKKKAKIYNFQYWEFIFQSIKDEYSEIRKNAIDHLNSYNQTKTNEIEHIFAELEDDYDKTANLFLEKKMFIEKHTTYFQLPKRTLQLKARVLIYQRLFKEKGFKAIKTKVKKDIT